MGYKKQTYLQRECGLFIINSYKYLTNNEFLSVNIKNKHSPKIWITFSLQTWTI